MQEREGWAVDWKIETFPGRKWTPQIQTPCRVRLLLCSVWCTLDRFPASLPEACGLVKLTMCSLFELGEERWLQLHPTCANMCSSWTERNISIVQSLLWLVRGGKLFSTCVANCFLQEGPQFALRATSERQFCGGCCVELKESKERSVFNIKCKCKMWTYRMWRWHENYDEDQDGDFMKNLLAMMMRREGSWHLLCS